MGDVPGLFEEREKINASIREKIQERNAERDEFRKQERAFNAYLAEVQQGLTPNRQYSLLSTTCGRL